MGSKFIVVIGDGETTRNNVEALVADFFYDRDKDYVLLLPYIDRPSQGQVWSHQIFQEMGMSTTALAPESAMSVNLGGATVNAVTDPTAAAIEAVRGEEAHIFVLVDEDHPIDLEALQTAQVPCYNLCMGLIAIGSVKAPQKPVEAPAKAVPTPQAGPSSIHADIKQLVDEFTAGLLEILREHGVGK